MFHTNFESDIAAPKWKYSLLWGALAFAIGLPVYAETVTNSVTNAQEVKQYAIVAGPLATTLREISRVSGTAIQFDSIDVQDAKAPAISGSLNTIAAVQQAISNSGLTMTTLSNGAIRVYIHRLGTITVTASRSEAEQGFKASRSSTATRSGADLKETPAAITVVTAKVIETQQAQSVQDILQNVAGVVTRESAQGVASYQVRGLTQTSALSNGVSNPYASSANVAGIERVEVLKGPQAILSGGDSLGGAVNIVTKKPTAERIRDVSVSYATHKDVSTIVDIGDAITDDKKLSYRVVGSLARADHNDAGFDGREADYLLGELRWKDEATDLTVGASYDKSYAAQNRYTIGLGGIQPIPSIRLGNKHDGAKVESKSVFYDFERIMTPWATLVSRLQYTETDQDLNVWNIRYPVSTSAMIMSLGNSNNLQNYKTLSGDHYVRFNFDTGAINHKLSTGVNHTSAKTKQTEYSGSGINASIYGDQVIFPEIRFPANLWSITQGKTSSFGYFAQDLMTWGDVHVLVGARRSKKITDPSSTNYPSFNSTSTTLKSTSETSSYNAGIVYDLTANTSIYTAYSTGFLPQTSTTKLCGTESYTYPDMETKNKEIGIKGESPTGGLSWSLAAYQLDQSNRIESNSAQRCNTIRDAYRIKGIELETAGRILPGWNVIFNYAYNKTKDTGDAATVAGAQPEHQASLWSTYDFQSDRLHGFGVSLGVTAYSDSRLGYTASNAMAPGGARVDAGVSYQHDKDWSLRLGVKNIFDRTLYGYAGSELYVPVYEGRNATLTWKYSF